MRIIHVSVANLFGLFNHSVFFNVDERVTIIHGANGVGKTAILRLIKSFFGSGFTELLSIPFAHFRLDFDNGSFVLVHKVFSEKPSRPSQSPTLVFRYQEKDAKPHTYTYDPASYLEGNKRRSLWEMESLFEGVIPQLRRVGSNIWQDTMTDKVLTFNEVIDRYREYIPRSVYEDLKRIDAQPRWLVQLRDSINIHFIESQRLFSIQERERRSSRSDGALITESVQLYSQEIVKLIKDTFTLYAELSQSLDRSFPGRLINGTGKQNLTSDEILDRLSRLEDKRRSLEMIGLLEEEEQNARFEMPRQIRESTTRNVLSVYVDDVEEKLSVFDTLSGKINILKNIVDSRFLHKTMVVDRKKGFLFTNHDGQHLSPTQLSSGEQNELVLLYDLLFKVESGSLILIDEPEISLHVAWQQQFLQDLQDIVKISRFDALVATHSPHIIYNRWDLAVEMSGTLKEDR